MAYHKPSLKRSLYTPTRTQRGGEFYLMVQYTPHDSVLTKWGVRHRTAVRALIAARNQCYRFKRVCVMRQSDPVVIWDSRDPTNVYL